MRRIENRAEEKRKKKEYCRQNTKIFRIICVCVRRIWIDIIVHRVTVVFSGETKWRRRKIEL